MAIQRVQFMIPYMFSFKSSKILKSRAARTTVPELQSSHDGETFFCSVAQFLKMDRMLSFLKKEEPWGENM